tara:strand:+ start:16 stop:294 length:279 start_codon:yes stop_codon:yes gene_type:complete
MQKEKTKLIKVYGKKEIEYEAIVEVPEEWDDESVDDYLHGEPIDTWEESFDPDDVIISDENFEELDEDEVKELDVEVYEYEHHSYEEDEDDE